MTYALNAWFGFATQSDKRRITAFSQRGKRSGLCPDIQTFTKLGQAADNKLFRMVLSNRNRVLHGLLPEKSNVLYFHNLRPRFHDRLLPDHTDQLIKL
jgi:hypothetical protein